MANSQALSFSIIIPCRNEENYIAKCIASVVENGYPHHDLEIIVADGMSTDATANIVHNLAANYPFVKLIQNTSYFTPVGLNLGIKQAKGDIILILGAHSVLKPGYLATCAQLLTQNPEAACMGGIILNQNENSTSKIIGYAMASPFGVGNARFRTGGKDGFVDTVAFGAYRKEVFDKAGLFDEELARNQDDEFNYRIRKQGFKIYYSSKLVSDYFVRASFTKLAKQYFQYGYWKVYVNQKHRQITSLRQLVPFLFVLFLLVGLPALLLPAWVGKTWLGILGFYSIGAVVAAFATKAPLYQVPAIVFSFLVLHISYGTGYLWGIVQFMLLHRKPDAKSHALTR
jgi:glycosyltransferase involved in cell wall biosynthesis